MLHNRSVRAWADLISTLDLAPSREVRGKPCSVCDRYCHQAHLPELHRDWPLALVPPLDDEAEVLVQSDCLPER